MIKETEIDTDLLFKQLVILPSDRVDTKAEETEIIPAIVKADTIEITNTSETVENKKRPFALFTPASLASTLLALDSNFNKIIISQKIPTIGNSIVSDFNLDESVHSYECIWTIGLSPKEEQTLLQLKHKNILLSPNVETLVSKEEKRAMFTPLMAFIKTNLKLISHL